MYLKSMLAVAAVVCVSTTAFAEGDAEKGKKVFKKKCMSCHAIGEGAKKQVGPPLTNVAGKPAGAFADFKYSNSMKAAATAGLVWTDEDIDGFLKNPKKFLRAKLGDEKAKSKMTLKLKKDESRGDVIAYLKSFGAGGGEMKKEEGGAEKMAEAKPSGAGDMTVEALSMRVKALEVKIEELEKKLDAAN